MPRADRCANPMRDIGEKGHCGKDLRPISKTAREKFSFLPANARICAACRKKISSLSSSSGSSDTLQSSTLDTSSEIILSMDDYQSDAGTSNTFLPSLLRSGRCYQTEKVEYNTQSNDDQMSIDGSSDDSAQEPSPKHYRSSREMELEEMLDDLKKKFSSLTSYSERLQILTVAPQCWSVRQISKEFDATRYMAAKAKKLKEMKGSFSSPVAKAGRPLSAEIVQKVRDYYEENSRMMPGVKDKISVNIDGEKKIFQKRMVLEDLQELHASFKKLNPKAGIGFSKFAELRPKYCVLAGASGTHTVCVCVYHQNCKLMLDAINISILTKDAEHPIRNYRDCLKRLMCTNATPACHMDTCPNCPGVESFASELNSLLSAAIVESVEFRVWQTTDRSTLQTQKLPALEFVDLLCERLKTLKSHHFIADQQTEFVKTKKENLDRGEILVHLDFSENYAFVVQDAAQSFHYNNDQCTVHPVVFYYHEDDNLHKKSFVVLSDCLTHDTAAVYLIQKILIQYVQEVCKEVKKIIYITDGAAQHYKNRYYISNLLAHKDEFHIDAEAHYYATAHGKTACDGIGAVLKREARRRSLQITQTAPILTPNALFQWAKEKLSMKVFFFTKEDHESIKDKLKSRFDNAKAIPGIQKNHCFIPESETQVAIKQYSNSVEKEVFPKMKKQKKRKVSKKNI